MTDGKSAVRKTLLKMRDKLAPTFVSLKDLSSYKEFESAKTVFCYVSAGSEVSTHALIKELLGKKRVLVPYCTDKCGNMIAVEITSFDELEKGFFGILSPKNAIEFPKEEIDFAIVPAIAFDKDGYRLGYGKGYYDRFLCDISPYKIGVCKKELFVEKLPCDKHDIKMDSLLLV